MKNIIYILLVIIIGCKSTSSTVKNKLDITKVKVSKQLQQINVTNFSLNDFETTLEIADYKKPLVITDKNGDSQRFENVKKVVLTKKTLQKKDSIFIDKKENAEKEIDTSIINKSAESVSDAKTFKSIFGYSALIIICLTVIFLIIRFRIKSKKDITV